MTSNRRRPRHIRQPKIYGYTIPDGTCTHAGNALPGPDLYTVAWRDVHKKKRPKKPVGVRTSYYFAFSPNGKWNVDDTILANEGMSPTHRLLQELIREHGFVQCIVNGTYFWMQYESVDLETHSAPIYEIGKGARRTDVVGRVKQSLRKDIQGTQVAVEIGVTSFVVGYERYADLVKADVTCLEIFVDRNKDLEERPGDLLKHLTRQLLNGELQGRWIVAPWRKDAETVSISNALLRTDDDRLRAQAQSQEAASSIERIEHALATIPKQDKLSLVDQNKLRDLDSETHGLLENALRQNRRDLYDIDFFQYLVELLLPPLRNARHRTLREQFKKASDTIRKEDAMKRVGLLTHMKKIESALFVRGNAGEEQRRELMLERNLKKRIYQESEDRMQRAAHTSQLLHALRTAGLEQILIPSGMSFDAAVAFEHRRWCGGGELKRL